ncbi:MAG: hypothetical protein LBU34_02235 [Planctomycetaceae bacterium]|jgi:hypothetical protein|nr:hypothetical protein [Planctomycetaceae bacterium]
MQHSSEYLAGFITFSKGIPGAGTYILPDIMNYYLSEIGEIKPAKEKWFTKGPYQVNCAINIANGISTVYNGKPPMCIPGGVNNYEGNFVTWKAMNWDPGVKILLPNPALHPEDAKYSNYVVVTLFTKQGTHFYTYFKQNDREKIDDPRWYLMIIQKYDDYRNDLINNQPEIYNYNEYLEEIKRKLLGAALQGTTIVGAAIGVYSLVSIALRVGVGCLSVGF